MWEASPYLSRRKPGCHRVMCDASLASEEKRPCLRALDNTHSVAGLTVMPLGHHTPGSVALYDPTARVLYFREELPPDGLVTEENGLRKKTRTFIAGWSKSPAVASNITLTSS